MKKFFIIALVAMFLVVGLAAADQLPPQKPENQVLSSTKIVDVTGTVIGNVELVSEQSSAYLHSGILFGSDGAEGAEPGATPGNRGEIVSRMSYNEEIMTDGGDLDLTYTLGYDSRNKVADTFNLETDTVLTYQSVGGSTLKASEKMTLDVAGNYTNTGDTMRCVFAQGTATVIPAFCNVVSAESTLDSVTSMAVQTSAEIRDTASSADIPAELNYKINVDPNLAVSATDAMGTVGVIFSASIMEGNDLLNKTYANEYFNLTAPNTAYSNYWDDPARITTYSDATTVTGGIHKFAKEFKYNSGVRL